MNERVRKVVEFVRTNGCSRGVDIGRHAGLATDQLACNLAVKYERAGWLRRVERGRYDLGPNIRPDEGSDEWLVLEQLKHGPLSFEDLHDLLDRDSQTVKTTLNRLVSAEVILRASGQFQLNPALEGV